MNNNLYTNYLARWNLGYVSPLLRQIEKEQPAVYRKLIEKTGLTKDEQKSWHCIKEKIYLPKKEGTNLLEQFEGYFDLENIIIEEYDKNDWPIRPKKLKHKKASQTQIIKQADVVMLMHLMGNEFSPAMMKENYDYYEKRTLHGSSLSPSVYSVMGLKVGDDSKAYRYLNRAAFLDLLNMQGNTREGIHAANTGGVWQTVVFGFAGVSLSEEGVLQISPHMPKEWERLTFRIHHRDSWLEIHITKENKVQTKLLSGKCKKVIIHGDEVIL